MKPVDFLSMAAVAGLLSWCAFDLFSRASDPYDITKPRQRIAPVGGITGHGEPWDVPTGLNRTSPKARGVAVNSDGIRDFSALASPSFPASFAGSIATRNQDQEVKPAPGRIERPGVTPPVQIKTREKRDGHSRANLTKTQLAAEVRAALPKLPKAEVDAAVWIIWRESGGRTTAKNPRSSSHGLNGFISRSWVSMTKRHGIKHSLEPRAQILALYHYCKDRYGSMSAARSFHRKRGWY